MFEFLLELPSGSPACNFPGSTSSNFWEKNLLSFLHWHSSSCFLILHKEPIIAFPSAFSILSHNLSLESGLFLSTVTLFYYLPTSQLCLNYQCYSLSSLISVPPMKEQNKGFKIIPCASSICPYSKDSFF